MANAHFEHHGHQVTITVLHTGERWSWSYQIDDRIHVCPIDRLWQTNGARIKRGTVGRRTPEM